MNKANRRLGYFIFAVSMFTPFLILGCVGVCLYGFGLNPIVVIVVALALTSLFKDSESLKDWGIFCMCNPRYRKEWFAEWNKGDEIEQKFNER